ncbi:MAG: hydrogenase maturation protease [Methanosarcinaceae archaeon]|nr:hydrogenase maturation protease [Methanosarcinaceae archaeon]
MKTVILCCGNPLATDDGVGFFAYEELKKRDLPENVELIDAGTGGLDILNDIEDVDKAIIVDSVSSGEPAGTLHRFTYDNDAELPSLQFSLHELGLFDVLKSGYAIMPYSMPGEIIIIGIEVQWTEQVKIGLSPAVEKALSDVIEMVLCEI